MARVDSLLALELPDESNIDMTPIKPKTTNNNTSTNNNDSIVDVLLELIDNNNNDHSVLDELHRKRGYSFDDIVCEAWQLVIETNATDGCDWLAPFLSQSSELLDSVLNVWGERAIALLSVKSVGRVDLGNAVRALRACVRAAVLGGRSERTTVLLLDALFALERFEPYVLVNLLSAGALLPTAGDASMASALRCVLQIWKQQAIHSTPNDDIVSCDRAMRLLGGNNVAPSKVADELLSAFEKAIDTHNANASVWYDAAQALLPRVHYENDQSDNSGGARLVRCRTVAGQAVARVFEWPADAVGAALALRLLAAAGGWQWTWSALVVRRLWPQLLSRGVVGVDAATAELRRHHVLRLVALLGSAAAGERTAPASLTYLRRLCVAVLVPVATPSAACVPPPPLGVTPRVALYTPHRESREQQLRSSVDGSALRGWLQQLAAVDALCELARQPRAHLVAVRAWLDALPSALLQLVPPLLRSRIEVVCR